MAQGQGVRSVQAASFAARGNNACKGRRASKSRWAATARAAHLGKDTVVDDGRIVRDGDVVPVIGDQLDERGQPLRRSEGQGRGTTLELLEEGLRAWHRQRLRLRSKEGTQPRVRREGEGRGRTRARAPAWPHPRAWQACEWPEPVQQEVALLAPLAAPAQQRRHTAESETGG